MLKLTKRVKPDERAEELPIQQVRECSKSSVPDEVQQQIKNLELRRNFRCVAGYR